MPRKLSAPSPTRAPVWDTVAIVGVGLLGASIGMALRRNHLVRQVVGIGRRESSLSVALRRGAIHKATQELAAGVAEAQLVVVCTPVARIVEDLRAAAAGCPDGAILTDVGSVKGSIVEALDGNLPARVTFIGSHPLAGSEKTGPAAASATLFDGRLVVLTPTPATPQSAYRRVAQFWKSLGARVRRMGANEHDELVASTSHVPHLAASALAAITPREGLPLVAGGWTDTTRVAAGDPDLWRQILLDNHRPVLAVLSRYQDLLSELAEALARQDGDRLEAILTQAKKIRDAVAS